MSMYVGIDLGTTNSTAALFDGERVTLVRNAQGSHLTPSVVRIDARGTVTVGARARRFLESDPQNTRGEFKRLLGTSQALEFPAAKVSRTPEALSAEVLRALRKDLEDQVGFAPTRAVVTVPALFELPQASATAEAARLAGFERVELLQEPVASALAAGWRAQDAAGPWLVYDLGGGTFDVSLLETRDGLLRVVGHDGDNFLGGRDLDHAVVAWALEATNRALGTSYSRADPSLADAVRRLKFAAEEARIELTRADEAALQVPALLPQPDGALDLDLVLPRGTLEALCAPTIERTVEVCQRLLKAHGIVPGDLSRVVLVGGPTVMPALRRRVSEALATTFAEGNDPMTLVAQGAALYAATAGLEAREPTPKASPGGRKVWLQFPAMSSDLTPHVLGRFTPGEGPGPTSLRLVRGDGLWHSPKVTVEPDGTFVTTVELTPRRASVFTLEARGPAGENVPAAPGTFTIVQGMTITDPPLSRTVGVATADNRVRVYFERGAPLPARRTFTLRTVDTVAARSAESALRVPVVQGEFEQASLCRLVGALELSGQGLTASLPAGSEVEVTLELDRGGRLSARALVPSTGNVFEEVAQLVVPEASPEALGGLAQALRARVAELRTGAFRRGNKATIERLNRAGVMLSDAERDTLAAQGGDTDSAQRARRTLLELDALLEECDFDQRWPALEDEARLEVSYAGRWVSSHGTAQEQTLLREAVEAVERARKDRAVRELQRQLRVVKNLGDTAFYRDPDTWPRLFEGAASRADDCRDLPRARQLVDEGRRALTREDLPAVRRCTEALWKLLPADAARRREGYDSGVR